MSLVVFVCYGMSMITKSTGNRSTIIASRAGRQQGDDFEHLTTKFAAILPIMKGLMIGIRSGR